MTLATATDYTGVRREGRREKAAVRHPARLIPVCISAADILVAISHIWRVSNNYVNLQHTSITYTQGANISELQWQFCCVCIQSANQLLGSGQSNVCGQMALFCHYASHYQWTHVDWRKQWVFYNQFCGVCKLLMINYACQLSVVLLLK